MIRRTCWIVVVAIHTTLIAIETAADLVSSGEVWALFFSFFLDYPISIQFDSILVAIPFKYQFSAVVGMHVVFGGIWWAAIICGMSRVISYLQNMNRKFR
jgi:hypothetical protein